MTRTKNRPIKSIKTNMKKQDENDLLDEFISIKLKVVNNEEIEPLYSDGFAIYHTTHDFSLNFLQSVPPVILEDTDMTGLEYVPTKCVARIMVSPTKMGEFVKAINTNWEKFKKTHGITE